VAKLGGDSLHKKLLQALRGDTLSELSLIEICVCVECKGHLCSTKVEHREDLKAMDLSLTRTKTSEERVEEEKGWQTREELLTRYSKSSTDCICAEKYQKGEWRPHPDAPGNPDLNQFLVVVKSSGYSVSRVASPPFASTRRVLGVLAKVALSSFSS
jgi:hypothetical protein